MTNLPFVSIIVPCRNEEKYIKKCLDSLIATDFPKERIEILVVDGMSNDETRKIVEDYIGKHSFVKLLDNPEKFVPFALNIGIKNSKGKIVIKADAHTVYERDYVSKCVKYLNKSEADNVGGILKTIPGKNTISAKAIAICLSHFLGAGGSYFRTGSKEPRWVDTVSFGCYKKEIFEKIGTFNEKMLRSEDYELNLRLRKFGGRILLVPDIVAYYYPQNNLSGFLKHNFSDGFWVTYPLKFGLKIFSLRHLLPLLFILGLFILIVLGFFFSLFWNILYFVVALYILINIYFAFRISIIEKNPGFLLLMPITFANRHFGYGSGSIWGLIRSVL